MEADRWNQIQDLFFQATAVPRESLEDFLEKNCKNDPELRAELNSLLDFDVPQTPLVSVDLPPVSKLANSESWGAGTDKAGERIGPYRLLHLLGKGGMGVVYLAVRDDDQFRKEVAIKLLNRGMDTDAMLMRFRMERQILANLEHPFIARLLDGAATSDGLPYIVMEYVDGLPITKHCEAKNFTIAERVRLFMLVCEAVQYAHRNLVVHRDLKPSNILVTKEGIPKLLDFGVATMISPDTQDDPATLTRREQRMLTPEYASPEQVRGERISTSSDIYALGTVLYELLTGRMAHRFTATSPGAIERVICDVEVERPSIAIRNGNSKPPKDVLQKSRRLSGDLDNIVLMAMRKEPRRRYQSPAELAEDLRRHLEGLPVLAREDHLAYRAAKFFRRNKGIAIAGMLMAVSLVAGIAATTFESGRASRRFDVAKQLANTMIYDLHDQMERLPGSTALRASMIETVVQYLDNLSRDAAGDPVLQLSIAKAYHRVGAIEGHPFRSNLGRTQAALSHYRHALDIAESLVNLKDLRGEVMGELIAILIEMGDIEAVLGNTASAGERFQRAAKLAADMGSGTGAELSPESQIYVYFRMGDEERNNGRPADAAPYFRDALDIAKKWSEAGHGAASLRLARAAYVRMANHWFESGNLYAARDNFLAARKLSSELLGRPDRSGEDIWGEIQILHAFGDLLGGPNELNLGDRAGALAYSRQAWEMSESIAKADRKDVRARRVQCTSNSRLGHLLAETDPRASMEHFRNHLSIAEELLGIDWSNIEFRREVALAGLYYGRALRKSGETEGALRLLVRSLELQQAIERLAPQRIWMNRPLGQIYLEIGTALLQKREWTSALDNLQSGMAAADRLLARAPDSVYLRRDQAEMMAAVGRAYATLASSPGAPGETAKWATESCALLEKCHLIWRDFERRGVAVPYSSQRARAALNELTGCRANIRSVKGS